MLPEAFHPAVAGWFRGAFPGPTSVQLKAWDAIGSRKHTDQCADGLGQDARGIPRRHRPAREAGRGKARSETTQILRPPLKALSNDIEKNCAPLEGIGREFAASMLGEAPIRAAVRTGDTPERARACRHPAHPRHDAGVAVHPAQH
jgi:ATP-dependent Lhr-like helicase